MKIFGGNHGRKPSAVHDETAPLPQVDTQEKKAGAPSRDNVGKGEKALPSASIPEKQPEGAAKGQGKSKETAAQPDQPQKDPGKPGQGQESKLQSGKKKKKRLKARYIPLIVLGVLLVLGVGVYAFLKAFAKPPDVSVKEPEITLGEGEEDPYADLVEPFIEDGDRERKDDYYTFMFCGTDDGGTRTDTIIVASYNVKTQEVNMVNIPRDTMSNVKRKIKKINSGFNGGPEQLEKELEMLLGIPIDRYVVVSFEGFEELIDLIGGVDFNVPTYMVWDDPSQDLHIYLEPGMQHLDGEKAIQLVRFRQNNPGVAGGYAEGDIGRIKMQPEQPGRQGRLCRRRHRPYQDAAGIPAHCGQEDPQPPEPSQPGRYDKGRAGQHRDQPDPQRADLVWDAGTEDGLQQHRYDHAARPCSLPL